MASSSPQLRYVLDYQLEENTQGVQRVVDSELVHQLGGAVQTTRKGNALLELRTPSKLENIPFSLSHAA